MTRDEMLAALEVERYAPSPTAYPTVKEAAERRAAGLDEHGGTRPMDKATLELLLDREAS